MGDREKMNNCRSEVMSKCVHKAKYLMDKIDTMKKTEAPKTKSKPVTAIGQRSNNKVIATMVPLVTPLKLDQNLKRMKVQKTKRNSNNDASLFTSTDITQGTKGDITQGAKDVTETDQPNINPSTGYIKLRQSLRIRNNMNTARNNEEPIMLQEPKIQESKGYVKLRSSIRNRNRNT